MSYTITIPLRDDIAEALLISKDDDITERINVAFAPFFRDEPTISRAYADVEDAYCFLTKERGPCIRVNLTFTDPWPDFILLSRTEVLPLYDRGDIAGMGLHLNKRIAQLLTSNR